MEQPSQQSSPHGTPLLRVVALLLFALLIATLSSLGTYYFLQNQRVMNDAESDESIYCTLEAKICPDGSSVSRVPPSCEFAPCSKVNYFEVKEMGFRFQINEDIKDLTYKVIENKVVYFSTKSLTTQGKNIFCSAQSGPLGSIRIIDKSTLTDEPSSYWLNNKKTLQQMAESGDVVKDFGELYIAYEGSQYVCSNDQDIANLQTDQRSALKKAFSTIEELN